MIYVQMKKIVLIGDGDNSEVIYNFITQEKLFKVKFIVGKINRKRSFRDIKHVSYKFNFDKILNDHYFTCTIADNFLRKEKIKFFTLKFKKIKWLTIVSNKSFIEKNVKIGKGTIIFPHCQIGTKSQIGKFCLINNSCHLEHHNKLNNFCSTGPKVVTGDNVCIEKMSYIGIGATIIHKINIGTNTIIGAKSLVNKDCKDNSVYYGHPSKYIRKRKLGEKYL